MARRRSVALLRGINVGGNRPVRMGELRRVFEELGCEHVITYINSGNVLYTVPPRGLSVVRIETAIERAFGFDVAVLVIGENELAAVVDALPNDWVNDRTTRCDVLFLWKTADRPEVLEELPAKPEIDEVRYAPGAVLWRLDRAAVRRSGLGRIIGTDLYRAMTIRNATTVRKLAELITTLPA